MSIASCSSATAQRQARHGARRLRPTHAPSTRAPASTTGCMASSARSGTSPTAQTSALATAYAPNSADCASANRASSGQTVR
eukprot:5477765-Prymnesium_polylepis.1